MKKIGILRAMGVRTNDIGKQFLFENIMIITISEIISLIVTGYMMLLINNKILMLIQKKDFDMFNYNYKVSILLSIMIFILGIIVTIVPFVKLIRKQSINLINNSKG